MKKVVNMGNGLLSVPNSQYAKSLIVDYLASHKTGFVTLTVVAHSKQLNIAVQPSSRGGQMADFINEKLHIEKPEQTEEETLKALKKANKGFFRNWFR
jgi:hypothetical protein